MSTENKVVKIAMDSAILVGLATGVGYVGKKAFKESFLSDPSSSLPNFGKWALVLTGATYLKHYLEDQKIIPKKI